MRVSACVLIGALLLGCALIFPTQLTRSERLLPAEDGSASDVEFREDGTAVWSREGLRIEVRHVPDAELNARFPQESEGGLNAYNPYTYGDYIDPNLGYTPARFTVFSVGVFNHGFARVELQPLKCRLQVDQMGQLPAYGIETGAGERSLEDYYRSRRGPLGNDDYRFEMRMGLLRTGNYASGEKIFRGENYSGLVVFDPLEDGVEELTLRLPDIVLRFNAFGEPLETIDVSIPLVRQISYQARQQRVAEQRRRVTSASLEGTTSVTGNLNNDITRAAETLDAKARSSLASVNACFETAYVGGKAQAGSATVRYVVLSSGIVESVRVDGSTGSPEVDGCISELVQRWRFRPAGSASLADSTSTPGTARPLAAGAAATVTATTTFSLQPVPE